MKISEAENAIAQILKQAEIDNDVVVKSISSIETEITCYKDDRRRFKMQVNIETERLPGRDWS